MRFGVVGGGFAYRADLLVWSGRPVRTKNSLVDIRAVDVQLSAKQIGGINSLV